MKIGAKQYARGLFDSLLDKNESGQLDVLDSFAKTLIENNQTSLLEEILQYFQSFWDKKEGTVNAQVISSAKLDVETIELVKSLILKKTAASKVLIKESRDKSLLGGLVLKYNDKIIDLSLKTKLNKFKDNLIN